MDAPTTELTRKEPEKPDPGCMAGCGTGSKKKKKGIVRETDQPQIRKEPVEGVELLWQPDIVKSYLSIMAEASNPETLEGSAGALHNLTACGWRVSMGYSHLSETFIRFLTSPLFNWSQMLQSVFRRTNPTNTL